MCPNRRAVNSPLDDNNTVNEIVFFDVRKYGAVSRAKRIVTRRVSRRNGKPTVQKKKNRTYSRVLGARLVQPFGSESTRVRLVRFGPYVLRVNRCRYFLIAHHRQLYVITPT